MCTPASDKLLSGSVALTMTESGSLRSCYIWFRIGYIWVPITLHLIQIRLHWVPPLPTFRVRACNIWFRSDCVRFISRYVWFRSHCLIQVPLYWFQIALYLLQVVRYRSKAQAPLSDFSERFCDIPISPIAKKVQDSELFAIRRERY